jgi:SHS2 domain-containing protein
MSSPPRRAGAPAGFGEELDMDRHELVVDANAVTLHRFALERVGRRWRAFVVLEI